MKTQKRILSLLLTLLMLCTVAYTPVFSQTTDNVQWAGSGNFNAYNNQVTTIDIPSSSSQIKEKWAYELNTTSDVWGAYYAGQPIIVGDYLYATGGGGLHKVNINTGIGEIIVESDEIPISYYDYLCYADGVIIVAKTNMLKAYSLDGTELGSENGNFGNYHPVQYHNGYLICNGYIYKLTKSDNYVSFEPIGNTTIGDEQFDWNSGVFVNNLFYTVSKDTVYAVDYTTGKVKDSFVFQEGRTAKDSVQGGACYDETTQRIFWGTYTSDSKLHSVKINSDGSIDNSSYIGKDIGQKTVCTPVFYNGSVYVAGQSGNVTVVNAENMNLIANGETDATKIQSNPIVSTSNGITKVLFQGYDGHLYVLTDNGETRSLKKIAETRNPTNVAYPSSYEQIAIDNSGRIYCYNESGYLFCFEKSNIDISWNLSSNEKRYSLNDSAEALTITSTASNGNTVSYQWQKSSDNVNWSNIDNATESSYTPTTDTVGTTYYRCVLSAEDSVSAYSSSAKIKVLEKKESVQLSFTLVGQDGKVAVSKDNTTELYKTPLTVTDKDGDEDLTVNDAFITLHELHSKNGAEDFASAGGYASRLWGIDSYGISYVVNNVPSMSLLDKIDDNDVISAFFYRDTADFSYSDLYTYFENDSVNTTVNTDVEFTVKGLAVMSNANKIPKNATVSVYDSNKTKIDSLSTTVDENGKFKVKFPSAGNYIVEVNGTCSYLGSVYDYITSGYVEKEFDSASVVPSRCFVNVSQSQGGGNTPSQKYVYISVKDPKGQTYLQKKSFAYVEGETVYDLLLKTGLDVEASDTQYGKYIESIAGLGEFDEGEGSGWMCNVNGTFPNYSVDKCVLSPGDVVEWLYTRDVGADVGGSFGGSNSTSTATTVTNSGNVTDIKTTVKTSNGNTTVTVSDKDIKNAVKKAESSTEKTTIVLSADVNGAKNVSFTLSYDSLKALSKNENVNVEISTQFGNVVISNEALSSILSQTGVDKNISISIETENAKIVGESKDIFADSEKDSTQDFVAIRVKVESEGKIIKNFNGNSLKLYIPVSNKKFEDQKEYRVYVISDDGTTETTTGKCVYGDNGANIEVDTTHLSTFIATTTYASEVEDNNENNEHWANKAINYVKEKGIMEGVSEKDFAPDINLTRAMLVTVLWRAENKPAVNYALDFKDVESEEWYAEAVRWATSEKIVEGYGDGNFGTNDFVSREQIATIIYRYAKYKEIAPQGAWAIRLDYSDLSDISAWATEGVMYCKLNSIMEGMKDNIFAPKNNATRAETATIIMRFFENISK